jgi:3-oxoacyl-[acyl-carrier-protein] synthase III
MSDTDQNSGGVAIIGTGSYLPEKILANQDLETMVDTSDEWIRTRTGIGERHIAADTEAPSDMAAEAARRALETAGVAVEELDLIIVGTCTPDMHFPNTACFVQKAIGAGNAFCFDIEAACSGFLYAMEIARNFIVSGGVGTALVIGAEKLSAFVDWEDRATCVLFGDGAGAAVLRAANGRRGILSCAMGSDGALGDLLKVPAGGSRLPASHHTVDERGHFIKMTGKKVFVHAVRCMCEAGRQALAKAGLTMEDVDWVVPHQANMRIIRAISDRLDVSMERFCNNLDRVGNTSAASVPLALDEAVRDGRIKRGDIILSIVFGSGFTWGAMVLEW